MTRKKETFAYHKVGFTSLKCGVAYLCMSSWSYMFSLSLERYDKMLKSNEFY